jgi:hypothetical protein
MEVGVTGTSPSLPSYVLCIAARFIRLSKALSVYKFIEVGIGRPFPPDIAFYHSEI